MRNILLTVSYDGTRFCGWQKQRGVRTVQEEIEKALTFIHKQPVVLYFFSPLDGIPTQNYVRALNGLLPCDIRIHRAEEKDAAFNARFSAVNRTYRYFFYTGKIPAAWEVPYVWHLYRTPDIFVLNRMAGILHGETDCSTFCAAGDKSLSKSRFIERAHFFMQNEKLVFEICANAFLWKMVRSLTGTMIELEAKGFDEKEFRSVLESKDRKRAGFTAPAQGLFLWNVCFEGKRVHV